MDKYTIKELEEALEVVSSTINNCEKMYLKFEEGTSQHTLLKNRIKALYISKLLIKQENVRGKYTMDELKKALPPISSIISKSEKAYIKSTEGTSTHSRLRKIIKTMSISKLLIDNEINR